MSKKNVSEEISEKYFLEELFDLLKFLILKVIIF